MYFYAPSSPSNSEWLSFFFLILRDISLINSLKTKQSQERV